MALDIIRFLGGRFTNIDRFEIILVAQRKYYVISFFFRAMAGNVNLGCVVNSITVGNSLFSSRSKAYQEEHSKSIVFGNCFGW